MSPFIARPFDMSTPPTTATTAPAVELVGDLMTVTPEWQGERCFIIAGGESVTEQRPLIPKLKGRVIAIKQSAALRPDADVMFISGKRAWEICQAVFPLFHGTYVITRGRGDARFPAHVRRIGRTKIVHRLSEHPSLVAGLDAGASAINLAYLFGATEIVLLGYDYCGARWCNGEFPHFQPRPPEFHHVRHMQCLPGIAADLKAKGIRVVNTSTRSRTDVFDKRSLEVFL